MYYYGARWYDAALGRFIQPDTIVPEPGNPQALNRYSYVVNNPLRYSDPTGHKREEGIPEEGDADDDGTGSDTSLTGRTSRRNRAQYFYCYNCNLPFAGDRNETNPFGGGHTGSDIGGTFTVLAPYGGEVLDAGEDGTAGMWRIQNNGDPNYDTGEILEWSTEDGPLLHPDPDKGEDDLYLPERLLASGLWIDLEPLWSHTDGQYVAIDHGHNLMTNFHHTIPSVAVGATVSAGDALGTTALIGWSYGTHLHYEVIFTYGGQPEYLNPTCP